MRYQFESNGPRGPYINIDKSLWAHWTWQVANRLCSADQFSQVFDLTPEDREGFSRTEDLFQVSTTPYYALLAEKVGEPLKRILMPSGLEAKLGAQQMPDPLAEDVHSVTPRVIHRYSDRVLFLVTDMCGVYCRFCTRKRFTGSDEGIVRTQEYIESLDYIRRHPGIREVIFSGGDPLTLSNSVLERILMDVRSIEHVEIIRIGSRMPVVCPMRLDAELGQIMRRAAPVFLMTHFNHPKELTAEAALALGRMVDSGVPVFNQSVLLNGVNNSPAIIQALNRRLLYLRVKPYYLFQCDPSEGTDHLRTTVEESEQIQRALWGHMSGLSMPQLILDVPDGGGKVALVPEFEVGRGERAERDFVEGAGSSGVPAYSVNVANTPRVSASETSVAETRPGGIRFYKGWDGRKGEYINPVVARVAPADAGDYLSEWEQTQLAKVGMPVPGAGTSAGSSAVLPVGTDRSAELQTY